MSFPSRSIALRLLTCASTLVPVTARHDWLREWRAELHHLHTHPGSAGPIAFALGSFPDAAHLWRRELALTGWLQSPRRCLASLAAAALLALTLCLALPAPRHALLPGLSTRNRQTFLIAQQDTLASDLPSLSFRDFDHWRRQSSRSVAQSAFYAPTRLRIQFAHQPPASIQAVLATTALLPLAPMRALAGRLPSAAPQPAPLLVLSDRCWGRHSGGHAFSPGTRLLVNGRPIQAVAIAASSSWSLPSHPVAWLFVPSSTLADHPDRRGFVLARFTPAAAPHIHHGRWQNAFLQPDQYDPTGPTAETTHWQLLEGVSLQARALTPLLTLALALLLALLALPSAATTSLGEYPRRLDPAALRRWLFLTAKLALATIAVASAALVLAYAHPATPRTTSQYLTFAVAFTGFFLAFHWTLRDQRSRCPICLALLRNPVAVGHPSRFLLAWSGTEWICSTGHGFLHVPALETSWFRAPRWLPTDPSWHSPAPARSP